MERDDTSVRIRNDKNQLHLKWPNQIDNIILKRFTTETIDSSGRETWKINGSVTKEVRKIHDICNKYKISENECYKATTADWDGD